MSFGGGFFFSEGGKAREAVRWGRALPSAAASKKTLHRGRSFELSAKRLWRFCVPTEKGNVISYAQRTSVDLKGWPGEDGGGSSKWHWETSAVVGRHFSISRTPHVVARDGLERQQLREEVGVGDRVREEEFGEHARRRRGGGGSSRRGRCRLWLFLLLQRRGRRHWKNVF